MAHVAQPISFGTWTAVDLVRSFGDIPLARVRLHPAPGTATEQDVVELHDRENRLFELVDGVLIEKTYNCYESYLGALISTLINCEVVGKQRGIVLGVDGAVRIAEGLVRIPDLGYFAEDRLPNGQLPRTAIASMIPNLPVDVISKSNTTEEMQRKLRDHFHVGVQLVWYVYPVSHEVHVYTAVDKVLIVKAPNQLDGGDVLPGLTVDLEQLFADPGICPGQVACEPACPAISLPAVTTVAYASISSR